MEFNFFQTRESSSSYLQFTFQKRKEPWPQILNRKIPEAIHFKLYAARAQHCLDAKHPPPVYLLSERCPPVMVSVPDSWTESTQPENGQVLGGLF